MKPSAESSVVHFPKAVTVRRLSAAGLAAAGLAAAVWLGSTGLSQRRAPVAREGPSPDAVAEAAQAPDTLLQPVAATRVTRKAPARSARIRLCQALGPAAPCDICAVDCSRCDCRRRGGWENARVLAWQAYAQGEYVGHDRIRHLPEYRLRVDDELDMVFRITREVTAQPYRLNVGEDFRVESLTVPDLNRDLIILTDDVYGTFTQGFVSLFAAIPDNTIGVYSWSKYFGATGWRLGIIALCEGNVLDRMLAQLPRADKDRLAERYGSITLEPENLKMIDRFVADSRAVALNHTPGLSTPHQDFMSLLSLFCLMDTDDAYKKASQDLVTRRYNSLYEALGIPQPADPNSAHYYTEIDIRQVAAAAYGQELADWIDKTVHPLDFVFRLADEEEVVLMPGGGFDAPKSSVRASLANLDDAAYTAIGKRTRELVDEYYQRWKAAQEKE